MILHLFRHLVSPTQTRGVLIVNGSVFAATLEDPFRFLGKLADKIQDKTAIPTGRYEVQVTMSARFKKKTPEILKVPFFTGIRLHSGRDKVDAGDAVDSSGCPLLLPERDGDAAGPTLTDRLVAILEASHGPHYIEVVNGWQGE